MGKTGTGYQSIHITASLSDSQFLTKDDYEKYKIICFEIQVRTLLQEAWAALNLCSILSGTSIIGIYKPQELLIRINFRLWMIHV